MDYFLEKGIKVLFSHELVAIQDRLMLAKLQSNQNSSTEEHSYIFIRAFFQIILDFHILINISLIFKPNYLIKVVVLLLFTKFIFI